VKGAEEEEGREDHSSGSCVEQPNAHIRACDSMAESPWGLGGVSSMHTDRWESSQREALLYLSICLLEGLGL